MKTTTSPRSVASTYSAMKDKISAAGGVYLSNGVFGTVFAFNGFVLKTWQCARIGGGMGGISLVSDWRDDPYITYLTAAAATPSIFHPRAAVTGVVRCRDGWLAIGRIELLEDHGCAFNSSAYAAMIHPSLGAVRDISVMQYRAEILRDPDATRDAKSLAKSLDAIEKHGFQKDLHGGNWMIRKNSNGVSIPVITDPVA